MILKLPLFTAILSVGIAIMLTTEVALLKFLKIHVPYTDQEVLECLIILKSIVKELMILNKFFKRNTAVS